MINDPENSPPSAQSETDDELTPANKDWMRLARSAFQSGISYVDTNYRRAWEDGLRAFNSQHSLDSKYNHPSFDKRSRLFRPKIRSIIRKNEAAGAAAFFSSMEVVSVTGGDPNSKTQAASAEVMKAILQYRLSKTIPWFQIVMGGLQDSQNVGVACAHVHWEYKAGKGEAPEPTTLKAAVSEEYPAQSNVPSNSFTAMGEAPPQDPEDPDVEIGRKMPKPLVDRPVVDLLPVENLIISPAADWKNPVESSPFLIHLMPVYMMDVKAKMRSGEWYKHGDGTILASTSTKYDSTRLIRQGNREDPYNASSQGATAYEVCWVQRHIHRKDDEDWEFYTLGDFALLTDPRPLKETVFHGKRPYVMGCCILEAHKLYPSSVGELGKGLQDEANEISNQRIDNVKFVLNKKWFVKRGMDVDIGGLMRNVPGGAVMMNNPETDVKEISWPDVTASSYEEQSRIDNDMNDLLGNFSPGQVMADHGLNSPARNMAMLNQSSGTLVEYLLRTFVETFVQPILRQLVLLEQKYETDMAVLALASAVAGLAEKFGTDEVTDEIIEQELNLSVNVGMGATDPQLKLNKFLSGMNMYIGMLQQAPPGINMKEVGKEIMGYMGYQDGSRFITQEDPQMLKMQQQMQEMQSVIQNLQMKLQTKMDDHQVKLKIADDKNTTELKKTEIHEDNENMRNATTHLRAITDAEKERQHAFRMEKTTRALDKVDHVRIPRAMSEGRRDE